MALFIALNTFMNKNYSSRHETANILLTGQNGRFLKIADFGLVNYLPLPAMILLAPHYLALNFVRS